MIYKKYYGFYTFLGVLIYRSVYSLDRKYKRF